MGRLDKDFYALPATQAAPELLGKLLCRNIDGAIIKLRITETECYYGEEDTACHAHKGRTPRTKTLYEPGGLAYVYLCYGIHNLLNIVTGPEDFPQAVLIRGLDGHNGPGRLTKALQIDRDFNGENLITSERLWIEDDGSNPPEYDTLPRVGIDYACEKYRKIPWRFLAK